MIEVDPRRGSAELCPLLNAYGSRKSVKAEVVKEMSSGDFAFPGHGPHGEVRVGIERKTLSDLINSMRTGRLAGTGKSHGQARRMMEDYQYSWLLVEGIWRGNPTTGILERAVPGGWRDVRLGSAGFTHAEVDNFLTSLSVMSSLKVRTTDTIHDTCLFLINLYKWWQKPWSQHRSMKTFHTPLPPIALLKKPTLVRRMANCLRQLGWEKTEAVDAYFKTPIDLVAATEEEWRRLPGIGKELSRRIVKAMVTGKED